MSTPSMDRPSLRRVRERPAEGVQALEHPEWAEAFPWLIQGTTTRGTADRPFDFALFGAAADPRGALSSWAALRLAVGAHRVVHARQVHGAVVRVHGLELWDHREAPHERDLTASGERRRASGLHLADPCDAHVTAERGLLLAVTTGDCVPVFTVDPDHESVALAHAGWRGAAAGVLERALEALTAPVDRLHVHLGPAICGDCYEVGPEVFRALDLPEPAGPRTLDLRVALAERAMASGVRPERITLSEHCTRCTDSGLFSHRGGDAGRQVGYLGLRP